MRVGDDAGSDGFAGFLPMTWNVAKNGSARPGVILGWGAPTRNVLAKKRDRNSDRGRDAAEPCDVAALHERYGPMIYRRILRFFRGDEAQEVYQEVFLLALEKRDSFRAEASPGTWLYRMATNHCLNRLRIDGRRRELLRENEGALWQPAAVAPSQEATTFLRQLWHRLPEDLARIGVHYYVDGMTHAEIARTLGVSRRTVGNRLGELERRAKRAAVNGRAARAGDEMRR